MQISSNSFYDTTAKRMGALSTKATDLQTQIATGKKVVTAADDPAAAQTLATLTRQSTDDVTYQSNMKVAASSLQQSDTTLGSIATQLQGALELAVQAANGTLNAANRGTVADQIDAISATLLNLANTRDANGQPLFGDADGSAAVTKNATGSYTLADTAPSPIPISETQSVQGSETASRIFTIGGTNAFAALDTLATALRTGTAGEATAAARSAMTNMTEANDQVSVARGAVGARAASVELQQGLSKSAQADRAELRSSIEDTDVSTAIVDLQKMMTALSATQASFSKLSSLSLFDYLR